MIEACDHALCWLLADVERRKGPQTQEMDISGENERIGMLKEHCRGKGALIEIQTEYAQNQERSICMQEA